MSNYPINVDLEKERLIINAKKVVDMYKDDFKVKTYLEALHEFCKYEDYCKDTECEPILYKEVDEGTYYLAPPYRRWNYVKCEFENTGWSYEYIDKNHKSRIYACLDLCGYSREEIERKIDDEIEDKYFNF